MYVQSTHSIVTSIKKHLEMKQDVGIAEQEKQGREDSIKQCRIQPLQRS